MKIIFKLINSIAILIVASGFFSSCNDDFLERYPIVNINDGSYWQKANDFMLYSNSFYNRIDLLPSYSGVWITLGTFGEDANEGSDTQISLDYNTRMNGEGTVPSTGGGWDINDWTSLRVINYLIDNQKKSSIPLDEIKEYIGEALFFRSLFYFKKLRDFGDLPYLSNLLQMDSQELFASRLPRNQAVDSIMLDLDHAIEYLPERTASWTGRVTKETAMLLQARIALFEGTWEKYHALKSTPFMVTGSDGSKFIRKAADVSGALMDLAEQNGNTALANEGMEDGYTNLFNQKDYSANKEILFWRKYSRTDGPTHVIGRYSAEGANRGLTKRMVDSYLCIDGKPISVSPLYQGDADLKTIVINRDPRMNQTITVDDEKHIKWIQLNTFFERPYFEGADDERSATGYQLYKGHNGDREEWQAVQSTRATIYFRYAEALLIYAEARAELGEITQNDIDKTVNALRRRVGMDEGLLDMNNITPDPNWDFQGISPLLNEIRRERKIELVCEGFRRDDIFRWAAADELIVGYIPKGAVWEQWRNHPGAEQDFLDAWSRLSVDDQGYIEPYKSFSAMNGGYKFNLGRDYLLPLPTNELTLNTNMRQNPGW